MNVRMKTTSAYIAIVRPVRERRASGKRGPSRTESERPPVARRSRRLSRSCCSETSVTAAAVSTIPWTTKRMMLALLVTDRMSANSAAPRSR